MFTALALRIFSTLHKFAHVEARHEQGLFKLQKVASNSHWVESVGQQLNNAIRQSLRTLRTRLHKSDLLCSKLSKGADPSKHTSLCAFALSFPFNSYSITFKLLYASSYSREIDAQWHKANIETEIEVVRSCSLVHWGVWKRAILYKCCTQRVCYCELTMEL